MARTALPSSKDPQSSPKAGSKRFGDALSSPATKRGKVSEKEQKTIEETMEGIEDDNNVAEQINEKPTADQKEKTREEDVKSREDAVKKKEDSISKKEQNGEQGGENEKEDNGVQGGEKTAFDEVKSDVNEVHEAAEEEQDSKTAEISKDNKSVVQDEKREAEMPSSIMEKGIIYFFLRGRVGVDDPQGVEDIARSYIVLRPLPLGAKLGEGPLQDDGNARLIVLPKKMLPKSKSDRFLMFVEKPNAFVKDLRDQFSGNEYATKTTGASSQPAATPFAEGIYALTSTDRKSHLAYIITYPEIGEVQKELGLYEKGSYVVSVKNPKAPGPANATIGNPAKYPANIQEKFRNLRWSPLEPEMLDYDGAQFLIIGEGMGDMGNAVEEHNKDKGDDSKEKPTEEMEKLEEEDHSRVEHLKEDDPVFADLGLSSKQYSKMQTTW